MNSTYTEPGWYWWMDEDPGFALIYSSPAPWKYVHLCLPFILCWALSSGTWPFRKLRYGQSLGLWLVSFVSLIALIWEYVEIILFRLGWMWYGQSDVSRMFDVLHAAIGAYIFARFAIDSGYEKLPKLPLFETLFRLVCTAIIGITNMLYVHSYVVVTRIIDPLKLRYASFGVGCLFFGILVSVLIVWYTYINMRYQIMRDDSEDLISPIRRMSVRSLVGIACYSIGVLYFGYSSCLALYIISVILIVISYVAGLQQMKESSPF